MADEFEINVEKLIKSDEDSFHDPFLDGNEKIERRIQKYNEKDDWANYAEIMAAIEKRIKEDGHLILPVIVDNQDKISFTFPLTKDEDGKIWNSAFTSVEEYKKGETGSAISHFIDSALKLCLDTPSEGFILNPHGNSVKLKKEYIDRILRLAGDKDYIMPEGPFTKEILQDGSILRKAARIFNKFPLDDNKEKLANILRESDVWVPCDVTISDNDCEAWIDIVRGAERFGTVNNAVRHDLKNRDEIRLVPHLDQSGILYFLRVFSSAGEMGWYGKQYSGIKMSFLEAMELTDHCEKIVSGVTVNSGSAVVTKNIIDGIRKKSSSKSS